MTPETEHIMNLATVWVRSLNREHTIHARQQVQEAIEALVAELSAAKARVAELERQLDHLKPLTEPARWGVERSPVLEAAMRGNNGPVLMSPPPDGTLARVAELEAEHAALKLAKEAKQ
jgi:hypothetical protein